MTSPAATVEERPSPASALEAAFEAIHRGAMRDVPLLHPGLHVEAVGFRQWGPYWIGVLVTPWFMNLVLVPRGPAPHGTLREGESRPQVFPAGVFEFIDALDPALGEYQVCSLFSPMFEFVDHASARATAEAALAALFDSASRNDDGTPRAQQPALSAQGVVLDKRDFLFGTSRRGDRAR